MLVRDSEMVLYKFRVIDKVSRVNVNILKYKLMIISALQMVL